MEEEKTGQREQWMARTLYDWLETFVVVAVALILLFTFVGRFIYVSGHSMKPTLYNNDMMVVQELGYTPKQGDVVVLTKEFAGIHGPIVKRVIAVGGQRVRVDYDEGCVYVDGQRLDEPYLGEEMRVPTDPNLTNHELVVPEGSIFVMGDNRNHSNDSRDARLGTVDERYIIGRALFVLLPFSNFGAI